MVSCGVAPAVGQPRDTIPLYAFMSEFHVQAFRALIMIMGRFGRILPTMAHDHGTAEAEN
jgi:hypothetical protein